MDITDNKIYFVFSYFWSSVYSLIKNTFMICYISEISVVK